MLRSTLMIRRETGAVGRLSCLGSSRASQLAHVCDSSRLRRVSAVAALAVTIAVAGTASATAETNKAIWGPVRMPDGTSAFPVYRDLGVQVLQLQLRWRSVAPTRPRDARDPRDPAYRWPAEIDQAVREARRYGIEVMLMVVSSPAWANGGRSAEWAPRDVSFGRFVEAASKRYWSVRRWMIWGEPSRAAMFQPLPPHRPTGPRRYATLLRAGYRGLKRRSRRNKVIGGMTFSAGFNDVLPSDFARWMRLPNGKPPPLDMYGHNPFSTRYPDLRHPLSRVLPGGRDIGDLDVFYRELRRIYRGQYPQFRNRGPRLWLSEYTISSDRANRAFRYHVTRRDQARWLTAAYRIARRNRWIAGLGWFGLLDEPVTQEYGLTTGLMTHEGERKPAYYAYRRVR